LRTDGLGWTLATVILAALLVGVVSWRLVSLSSMPRALPDVYLELPAGEAPALAPDRSLFAYASRHGDDWMLHLRALEGGGVSRLKGTEGARSPCFSFDGESLAFVSAGEVKVLSLGETESKPRSLAAVGEIRGASWASDGSILFGSDEGIRRLATSGGEPVPETLARPSDAGPRSRLGFPRALPAGGWVLFDARDAGERHLEAVQRASGERHRVLDDASLPRYAGSGHLLFLRGASIWAIRFDADSARTLGDPAVFVSGVDGGDDAWYDLSAAGTLAFRRPPTGRADHRVAFGVVENSLAELERLLPD
jgi:hypothetical protein